MYTCMYANINYAIYARQEIIDKDTNKFSLLWGEAQLCLPYFCLKRKKRHEQKLCFLKIIYYCKDTSTNIQ